MGCRVSRCPAGTAAGAGACVGGPFTGADGLKHSGRVLKAGLVTDGPYVEAKEIIVSFTIIQADNYDAALAIARACPPGHTIEIREFAGYA